MDDVTLSVAKLPDGSLVIAHPSIMPHTISIGVDGGLVVKPILRDPIEPKGGAQLAYNIQLRDLFACQIMPALLQGAAIAVMQGSPLGGLGMRADIDDLAKKAYEIADAMVKAR